MCASCVRFLRTWARLSLCVGWSEVLNCLFAGRTRSVVSERPAFISHRRRPPSLAYPGHSQVGSIRLDSSRTVDIGCPTRGKFARDLCRGACVRRQSNSWPEAFWVCSESKHEAASSVRIQGHLIVLGGRRSDCAAAYCDSKTRRCASPDLNPLVAGTSFGSRNRSQRL